MLGTNNNTGSATTIYLETVPMIGATNLQTVGFLVRKFYRSTFFSELTYNIKYRSSYIYRTVYRKIKNLLRKSLTTTQNHR